MKKILFALGIPVVVVVLVYAFLPKKNDTSTQANAITFTKIVESSSYVEYAFDAGDDRDLGFTKRAYEQLQKDHTLLSADNGIVEADEMTYSQLSEKEMSEGVIARRTWGDDVYELMQTSGEGMSGLYEMTMNGKPLFEARMDFGAEGPIQDWRIVDGKPAFTFGDIWYDGSFMSEKFDVVNPRYLFSSHGKIGFIAENNGKDVVLYDGEFITPGFDTIWTHNCCSYTEILPTVYENGTLLFYAMRDEVTYLVEARLE